jgi:CheY-like chemotaxis protein
MKTVLVVDDEPEIVDLVSMALEQDQVHLLAAYDGEEALQVVGSAHPHLVLSDVMMPRLDGCRLSRRIRSNPSTSETVVILMSAAHNIDPADCGASELIPKPFDLEDLAATVQRFLSAGTS